MTFKGRRVFISGGSGVIGTELVEKLYDQGAIIFVGDLKPIPHNLPQDILYRQGDLNYITADELNAFNPEFFFHLAATFERSTETYEFWDENYQHNVNLSHHLMNCLKSSQSLKKVVFASSYLIYDPDQYNFSTPKEKAVRLGESNMVYPRNLCGVAKFSHEIELRFLNEFNESRFESVSARIFRSYGKNSRDIISRWVRALLKGEELTVYRKEGMFDYIYAGEVAEGLIRLAVSNASGIYNLGNDNARRVEEVVEVLKRYFPEVKTRYVESDIPFEASQANMKSFKEVTGWMPSKQLEDTIPEIIEFEKTNLYTEVTNPSVNILVTSISKKVPLIKAIKKSSLKIGNLGLIIGADADEGCVGRHFVDKFWKMPKLTDLQIEEFINYCKENNISCVIPTRDGELSFFAKYKNKLYENGIKVMVSNMEAVKSCLDKLAFYENTSVLGIPVISTVLDINNLNYNSFVVKERFGAGSLKIGLGLTKDQAIKHSRKLENPIFQPLIEGNEISIDLYVGLNGKVKGSVARTRDLVVGGESQITSTIRNSELEKLCSNLAEKLNLYGHIVLQVIIDEKEGFHIIECNSRFGGASTLSLEAGLDSFYWFLLESLGVDISGYPFVRSTIEKKQVRFAEDLIIP